MRNKMKSLALALPLLLVATAVLAGSPSRIRYSVSASSTNPAATVVSRNGETVVIFKEAAITAGDTFSFTLGLDAGKHASKLSYPINADFNVTGSSDLQSTIDPASVTFNEATDTPSAQVTVTVAPGDYSHTKRLSVKIKAMPQAGAKLGAGPGVKVVILKSKKASASAEAGMLQDLQDALTPEPSAAQAAPQPAENW
ncbi:MAG: hypothetical protein ACP5VF_11120 [Acidobacteriota bacterium]